MSLATLSELKAVAPDLLIDGNPQARVLILTEPAGEQLQRQGRVWTDIGSATFELQARGLGLSMEGFLYATVCPFIPNDVWGDNKAKLAFIREYQQQVYNLIHLAKPELILATGRLTGITLLNKASKQAGNYGCIYDVLLKRLPSTIVEPINARVVFAPEINTLTEKQANITNLQASLRAVVSGLNTKPRRKNYRWATDLSFLLNNPPKVLAWDTETTGLDWWRDDVYPFCIQFAWSDSDAVCVPLHPAYYPELERDHERIVAQVRQLLTDERITKVGHNIGFDFHQLDEKLGIIPDDNYDDTMVLSWHCNENLPLNLNDCTRHYAPALGGINDALEARIDKTKMLTLDKETLLEYGCNDVCMTFAVHQATLPLVKADKYQWNIYKRVQIPMIKTVTYHLEKNGLDLPEHEFNETAKRLNEMAVSSWENLVSQLPEGIKEQYGERLADIKLFNSLGFLRDLFFSKQGLNLPVLSTTGGGEASTSIKTHLNRFMTHSLVRDYCEFSKIRQLIKMFIGKDDGKGKLTGYRQYMYNGKIRPSYNITGTVTARPSCVHEDTLITTKRGEVKIKDIVEGDEVYTHKLRWRKVQHLIIKPVTPMYDVSFSNGKVLRLTSSHRLLTITGKWRSLDDGIFKTTVKRFRLVPTSDNSLPRNTRHNGTSSETVWHNAPNRIGHGETCSVGGGVQSTQSDKVFLFEIGRQEPSFGQKTYKLQRGVRRRLRVLDAGCRWDEVFYAPCSVCTGDGATPQPVTRQFSDTPYRPKQTEQPLGQLSSLHQCRSSGNTFKVCSHGERVTVTRIDYAGSYRVYDITVADDHSYLAAGVFSHNSSSPNGQNFPQHGDLAQTFLSTFKAPDGWVYVKADFSQLELRVLAWASEDPEMLRVYRNDEDIHFNTASSFARVPLDEFKAWPKERIKEYRQKAKGCIAKGSLVQTHRGLKPIESVAKDDLVWDGDTYVKHGGVKYQGKQRVATYDGLTATLDHIVYTPVGAMCFGHAIVYNIPLVKPLRYTVDVATKFVWVNGLYGEEINRGASLQKARERGLTWHEYTEGKLRRRVLASLLLLQRMQTSTAAMPKLPTQDNGVLVPTQQEVSVARPTVLGARGEVRCHKTKVQASQHADDQELRGQGHRKQVCNTAGIYRVCIDSVAPCRLQGYGYRPSGQRRPLRRRELTTCKQDTELNQQANYAFSGIQRSQHTHNSSMACSQPRAKAKGLALVIQGLYQCLNRWPRLAGSDSARVQAKTKTQDVYDLLNVGHYNRFVVSECLVSNSNFGLSFKVSVEGFIEFCYNSYGIVMSQAEAEETMELWYSTYPNVRNVYWNRIVAFAKKNGYARSVVGHKRHLPDMTSSVPRIRGESERGAINNPIQGAGALIGLAASNRVRYALERRGLTPFIKYCGFIHDALLFKCREDYVKTTRDLAEWAMTKIDFEKTFLVKPPEGLLFKVDFEFSRSLSKKDAVEYDFV